MEQQEPKSHLEKLIAEAAGTSEENILGHDLFLYNLGSGNRMGG